MKVRVKRKIETDNGMTYLEDQVIDVTPSFLEKYGKSVNIISRTEPPITAVTEYEFGQPYRADFEEE